MPAPGAYIVQQYTNVENGTELWTLYSDGTVLPPSGGGAPGGVDGSLQFNSGGVLAGNDVFTYDPTNGVQIDPVPGTPMSVGVNSLCDGFNAPAGNMAGGIFIASLDHVTAGPVSVTNFYGLDGEVTAGLSAGEVDIVSMVGVRSLVSVNAQAIVTNLINFDAVVNTLANVSNYYGLHIPDLSAVTATTKVRAIQVDNGISEFDGPGGFGANTFPGQIGPIGYASGDIIGAPRSRSLLDVEGTFSTPDNLHFTTAAIVAGIDANAAADDTNTSWYGVFSTAQSRTGNTHHMSELVGGLFQAEHYATGLMDEVNGLFVQSVSLAGSGAVTANIGVDVSLQAAAATTTPTGIGLRVKNGQYNASGTITNSYGIQVVAPNTTGHLTHNYGIRIEDQSAGGANNPDPWSLYVVGGTSFFGGPLQLSTITKMNSETTAGAGVPYIRGVTLQKSETGADAAVLTVTPTTLNGLYRIAIVISVSAASAATIGWTATWRDSNATAQAPTNLALNQAGVAAPALTFSAAAGATYFAEQIIDVNNAGTNIVIKTTFAGTSIAYKVSASIERLI